MDVWPKGFGQNRQGSGAYSGNTGQVQEWNNLVCMQMHTVLQFEQTYLHQVEA